jgi:hypothetical protein
MSRSMRDNQPKQVDSRFAAAHYQDGRDLFPTLWMRMDYTCGCGLYVHPKNKNTNPKAIHIENCPWNIT